MAKGLRKTEGGKYCEVGGGSCWTVVRRVSDWAFAMRIVRLTVAHVVVEWHVFATGLQGSSILDHFRIESIEVFMRDGVLDHDQAVFVKASYGCFQVA